MTSSGRVVSAERVLYAAERYFHEHSRLDMAELAASLSVSRATLYRVAGSRERLLGDVLWYQGSRAMQANVAAVTGTGVDRLVTLARTFNEGLIGYAPLREFLRTDAATAFRVLFMNEGRVHARFVEMWRNLFAEAADAGELELPFDVDELAFVFVRMGESMLYADLLSGLEPDIELAARVQRLLLSGAGQSEPAQSLPSPPRSS